MQHYQRIRDLREDSDLTQQQLCERLQMHKTTYTNYEQGKHTVPLDFALTLADFYDVSIDYIAGRTQFRHSMYREALSEDEQLLHKVFVIGEEVGVSEDKAYLSIIGLKDSCLRSVSRQLSACYDAAADPVTYTVEPAAVAEFGGSVLHIELAGGEAGEDVFRVHKYI